MSTETGDETAHGAPGFVVVEGPIGVGKTSLANRLALSFGCDPLLEQPHNNPFLERFYKDPKAGALPTQLFFLFQRARQLEELRQSDLFNTVRVSDFLIDKDRIFAELNLDPQEFSLYEQVYAGLDLNVPSPDLVVYLQAPVDVLMNRIARRGIGYEQQMERRYLERLMEAYAAFFHKYEDAPLLIVNAGEIDLVNNEADYQVLFRRIVGIRGGRHYFNPATNAIA